MSDTLWAEQSSIGRRSLWLTGLRAGGIVLNLGVTLALGRYLGVSRYGIYAAVLAVVQVLSVLATLGGSPLLVRWVARVIAEDQLPLMRGLLVRSAQVTLVMSGVIAIAVLAVAVGRGTHTDSARATAVSAAVIPLLSLALIAQAALQGSGSVTAAFLPLTVIRPLLLLAAVGVSVASGAAPSAAGLVLLQAVVLVVVLVLLGALVAGRLGGRPRGVEPAYANREWGRGALGLGLTVALATVTANVGTILAGVVGTADTAGLLAAAIRAAVPVTLLAWAANDALQPVASRLHATGQRAELQAVVTHTTRRVAAATTVAALAGALLATPLLGLLGHGFTPAAGALRLLCLAAVINSTGLQNMTLLTMTGNARSALVAGAVGAITVTGLCAALVPSWGATGAAAAYMAGSLARNVIASWLTSARLGIESTVIGPRRRAPRVRSAER